MAFAKVTVAEWLRKYKFRTWAQHRTTNPGAPVTEAEKATRADQIAEDLCRHSTWKVHGRSLRLPDLKALRLEITDYSQGPDLELHDAIQRYYTLLRLSLDMGNAFKIIETVDGKVVHRFNLVQTNAPQQPPQLAASSIVADVKCNTCGSTSRVQMNFGAPQPPEPGAVPYPVNDQLVCSCGATMNLRPVRDQLEKQAGRPIVT